jgi:hypothetical protein
MAILVSSCSLLLLFATACGSVRDTAAPGADGGGDGPSADCTPNTTVCTSGQLTVCGAAGTVQRTETCAIACASSGDACQEVAPANGLAAELDGASTGPDAVFSTGAIVFNSDTGDVTSNGGPFTVPSTLHSQGSGLPQIRVFQFKSLAIRAHTTITGTNAIALVSRGAVEIAALVEIAGRGTTPAPGAITATSACQGGDSSVADPTGSTTRVPGAGGAGFGTAGGNGGSAIRSGASLASGGARGSIAGVVTLEPLRGGCRGGSVLSFQDAFWATSGGGGGGALQISSRTRITVTSAGMIDAGGGGAFGGKSGAGGGSGGALLLEAPQVSVDGTLVANGGAGGCFNVDGEDGQVAYRAGSLEAKGGSCNAAGGVGSGGSGGTKDMTPSDGVNASTTTVVPIGGGGGGAAGRVHINSLTGTFTKGATSLVSPLASEAMIHVR